MIPPPVSIRPDGVLLNGRCGCSGGGSLIQLLVVRRTHGRMQLSFHGTAEHSILLTPDQLDALRTAIDTTADMADANGGAGWP
jgi:hypothetical protein